ncbi:PKD domain-containing protein [Hymenobacter sp. BT635]|uniref:PKD domain-containing protein n=1 Tax=Hymenobacter nitidus TaxID=2880929 RepID=A0ABS8ADQ8_9BACT|nr:PKD domain-containing protein [Hymenobacter nitidus]MCB2378512.1 PKD domain-containing protein [Hymenobacter nitidus]
MKHIVRVAVLGLFSTASLLLTACEKEGDDYTLEGPLPQTSYTTSIKTVGLTSEVTFTATGADGFLYQWDFGDESVGTGKTVTHVYKSSGAVKTKLTVAGRGGTSFSDVKEITLPPVIDIVKQLLTGGSSKTWMLQNDVNAPITVGTEANPAEYFGGVTAGSLPTCQSDDEYTFSNTNNFIYNAKAETFVAGDFTCQAPRSGSSDFTFGPATGQGYAMIEFKKAGTFIGVTDAPDLTYRIIDISATNMVLRAGKPGGTVFQFKMVAKP